MMIPVAAVGKGILIGALASALSFWLHANVRAGDQLKAEHRFISQMISAPAPPLQAGHWGKSRAIDCGCDPRGA